MDSNSKQIAEYVCGYCGEPTPEAKRSSCCGDAIYPARTAEYVVIEVRSKDLRPGDLLHAGRDQKFLVTNCWHTDSGGGCTAQGLWYYLTWSEYEILTVERRIDGPGGGS